MTGEDASVNSDALQPSLDQLAARDLERACLSCLLHQPELVADAEVVLQEEDFVVPHHRVLYHVLRKLATIYFQQHASKIIFDTASIVSHIHTLGFDNEYLKTKGTAYIESLRTAGALADVSNFEHYLQTIKSFSTKRKMFLEAHRLQQQLLTTLDKPADQFLVETENRLLALGTHHSASEQEVQLGAGVLARIQATIAAPKTLVGISTGFLRFDEQLSGLRRKSLTVLMAKTKGGKSAFLLNLGLGVAKQQIPVYMISTEMSNEETADRAVANLAGVTATQVKTGHLNDEEQVRVISATRLMAELPFYHIHTLGFTPDRIGSLVRRFVHQHVGLQPDGHRAPCLILFDYLKTPSAQGSGWMEKEYQILGDVAQRLKDLAAELDVPIVTAGQTNREGDFATAFRVLWFVDYLLQWIPWENCMSQEQKKTMQESDYYGVFKLKLLLGRDAQENPDGIFYRFDKPFMRIWEDVPRILSQADEY